MIVKIHKQQQKTIVAVCDESIWGKKIEEKDIILDLSSNFYNGEKKNEAETGDLIRNSDGVNLVGEQSVKIGIEEGVVDQQNVKKIQGIPYAQAVILHEE